MKVPANKADGFLKAPPDGVFCFLFFGPEEGVKRDRAHQLSKKLLGENAESMNLIELTGDQVSDDPAKLSDELNAFSMLGGDRVIILRNVVDKAGKAIKKILEEIPQKQSTSLIVEAGDLKPSSALRKYFEATPSAAAIGCYADEGYNLKNLIQDQLREQGYSINGDAVNYLEANLSGNRLMNRQALEKLMTYAGDSKTISLVDAEACVGNQSESLILEVSQLVADGNLNEIDKLLSSLFREGTSPVAILIMVSRHFQKLLSMCSEVAMGKNPAQVVQSQRPPVFFKLKDRLIRQLGRWQVSHLQETIEILIKADRQMKTTGLPHESICRAALFKISTLPRTKRQRKQA